MAETELGSKFIEIPNYFIGTPHRVQFYELMMYPQYQDKFGKTITKDVWHWMQVRAATLLAEDHGIESVQQHWRNIIYGIVPFGYRIED